MLNDGAALGCAYWAEKLPEGRDHRPFSPTNSAPKAAFGSKTVNAAPVAIESTWCQMRSSSTLAWTSSSAGLSFDFVGFRNNKVFLCNACDAIAGSLLIHTVAKANMEINKA